MRQPIVWTVLLGSALIVGMVTLHPAHARSRGEEKEYPVSTGVVATITAINPRNGMATLTTESGAVYTLRTGTSWKVGNKVECQQIEEGSSAQLQQCQPWE